MYSIFEFQGCDSQSRLWLTITVNQFTPVSKQNKGKWAHVQHFLLYTTIWTMAFPDFSICSHFASSMSPVFLELSFSFLIETERFVEEYEKVTVHQLLIDLCEKYWKYSKSPFLEKENGKDRMVKITSAQKMVKMVLLTDRPSLTRKNNFCTENGENNSCTNQEKRLCGAFLYEKCSTSFSKYLRQTTEAWCTRTSPLERTFSSGRELPSWWITLEIPRVSFCQADGSLQSFVHHRGWAPHRLSSFIAIIITQILPNS